MQRLDRGRRRRRRAQEAGGVGAGLVHRAEHAYGLATVAVAGRDGAEQVPADGVEGRLVDRLPPRHQVAEGLAHPVDVAAPEQAPLLVVAEAVEVVGEPAREREVVEAHPDREAGVAAGLEDGAVALDLLLGVVPLPRLEPVPVERQAVVGQAVLGVEREVLGVAGGEAVPVTGARRPPCLLPRPPVAAGRRALRLRGRGARAPDEPLRPVAHGREPPIRASSPDRTSVGCGPGRSQPRWSATSVVVLRAVVVGLVARRR